MATMFRALVVGSVLALATRVASADDPAPEPAAATIHTSGRVIDMRGKPVRDASVGITGGAAVKTDDQGRFSIDAPEGTTLVIDSDPYSTALATVTGPVLDDIVLMRTSASEQIEVKGQLPTPAIGASQLDREELQRLPGTGGDVVRTLSAMPGVVNVQIPLGYSGVVIRGSSPQDSKVLVDGFEIPILFHPFGFRAILPVETVQSLTFIPGGFGVEYGRSSSGIVALTTRPGADQRSTQAELSLIDGGLVAQGKLDDKTHYMVGFRRSVIDLVLPLVIPSSVDLSLTTVPSYYDEQLRIDHELSSNWNLALSSIGTDRRARAVHDQGHGRGREAPLHPHPVHSPDRGGEVSRRPVDRRRSRCRGCSSDLQADVGLYQRLDVFTPMVTPRAVVTRTAPTVYGLKDVVWSSGVEAQISHATLDIAIPLERREGEPYEPYDPKDTSTQFKGSIWYPDYAAWTSVAATLRSAIPDDRRPARRHVRAFRRGRDRAAHRHADQARPDVDRAVRRRHLSHGRPSSSPSSSPRISGPSARPSYTMGLEYVPILGVRIQGSLYYNDRIAADHPRRPTTRSSTMAPVTARAPRSSR